MNRPTDTVVVERFSRGASEPLFFRPVRAAVARLRTAASHTSRA
jgi:hypothetical protein